ncbi:polysaccharide biosynthesis tyrosine autokinase [Yoonia sp. SS1-5]|uniref:non-specific protein-tyrosine kinase n=1 Tax=Yoonia rhodophyticola TaxID=3137370 RepID=A0AAN0MEK5_9RHOB
MNDLLKDLSRPQSAVSAPERDEIDLRNLVAVLWRGKFWIILCAFLATCVGGYYAFAVAVPVYSANATVVLENRQDQVIDLESVVSGLPGDQVTINTEVEVLRSRRLVEKLVVGLNLTDDPEFNARLRPQSSLSIQGVVSLIRQNIFGQPAPTTAPTPRAVLDAVIDEVLRKITVTNVRQSYVFRVAAVTESPEKSALIANRLAQLYIDDQIDVKFERTEEATEWLSARVGDLQIELENAEAQLKDYSSNTDLISPEGLVALNRQLKELRDRREGLAGNVTTTAGRLDILQQAKATGDITQMADAANDRGLDQLLAGAEGTASGEAFRRSFEQILARAELAATRARTQLAAIDVSIAEITQRIATQSDELVRLQQLQREAEASGLIYEYFLSRLKETSVQQGIQQADSRVLSQAVVPINPSAPRKSLVLAMSLILGTMLGAALVLLRELSQNTFRIAEDLEARTGYPVIGQIPVVPARKRRKLLQYLQDKPNSAAAEAVRNLRTSILLANLDNPPKVILSTSSVPGEGKTTQSIALAQNLAGLGKKVLLVEGDIRRRVFQDYFDIPERIGLLTVLLDETRLDEAVTHLPEFGFDVLLGEKSKTNAADLYSSDKFGRFLDTLRAEYDYVIIDTPPVLAVTDARIIARWVDATIYTVKWDSTSHRQVLDGLKSFRQVNVRVSGLVLGQISPKGMKRYGYGDSYGAYNSYYDT